MMRKMSGSAAGSLVTLRRKNADSNCTTINKLVHKAAVTRGCFGCLKPPPEILGKHLTHKNKLTKFAKLTTRLGSVYQFRPGRRGLAPTPVGKLTAPSPRTPHCLGPLGLAVSSPNTSSLPKINPSYGLASTVHIYVFYSLQWWNEQHGRILAYIR